MLAFFIFCIFVSGNIFFIWDFGFGEVQREVPSQSEFASFRVNTRCGGRKGETGICWVQRTCVPLSSPKLATVSLFIGKFHE